MCAAYYNEIDPRAAAWLRELIRRGLIADGTVDERSIVDVQAADLVGYTQCHFFAGVGGWSYALRLAGWTDERAIWTGSCPCPPFSCAGRKKVCPDCQGRIGVPHPGKTGVFVCAECQREWYADGRHLWPEFHRLIAERGPSGILGEQVSGSDGRVWLAGVRATLEAIGYAVGGLDTCAAGVGAPQIRQRLYWVASADGARQPQQRGEVESVPGQRPSGWPGNDRMANAGGAGLPLSEQQAILRARGRKKRGTTSELRGAGDTRGLSDAQDTDRRSGKRKTEEGTGPDRFGRGGLAERSAGGFWSDFELCYFRDGKTRRVEPGTFPLAAGVPDRVVRLRGYGNAIVPPQAAEFIKTVMDIQRVT